MGTEPVTGAGLLSTQRLDATPSSDADDLTGAELPGRFRLDRLLASGAFGTVYRARQLAVDRDVAVKVLHADIDPDSEDGRLFIHEIQAVGRIDHVNVVRIYQADVAPSGRLFFAMELLHGDDLQQVIDRDGPLPRTRALALIAQLLAGLGAAHDLGLVHADVKPGNLVVVGERLVLVDFGLARLRPPNQAAESMGGTPAYMAPEQLRDGRVDARSDLFAVGLVVVALLTGWQRVDLGELVPPLDTLIVDPELRAVLARALALDPAQRYQSAAELARALTGGDVAIAAPARSPFRHLAPFTEADRDHLHGRDRDVAALVEQLAIRRVLVYTAPSGTGKTSLLRAGLVPRLTALGLRALYVSASADGAAATVRSRLDARPEVSVQAAIETWHRGGGARVAVIVDQVEAVLDGAHDDGAAALVRELLGLERADVDAVVVLSVREDFLGRLLAFDPRLQAGVPVVRLPPLARDGAQAAIVLALAAHHIAIEPALLERLLDDLEAAGAAIGPELGWGAIRAVYPPHLQLACSVLYDELDAGATTLTVAHYQRLGGFDAIVGEYLERVLDSELDADAARIARELFVGLVSAAHTRTARTEAELLELAGPDVAGTRAVLDALTARGLLVRTRGRDGDAGWELIHDSLVPRVEAWLDRRDLSRRRAIELLRHHLRRSTAERPSLLAPDELRELRGHASAVDELDAAWRDRGAPWPPRALMARSRRAQRRRTIAVAAGITVVLAIGAALTARWLGERERRAHERRLSDRDLGRVTLALTGFDWDPRAQAATPVALPALSWAIHAIDPDAPDLPGAMLAHGVGTGATVEVRGGDALLVIDGRGGGCAPSVIPLHQLPGYARRRSPPTLALQVPSCQASRADQRTIAGGVFVRGGPGVPPSSDWRENSERLEAHDRDEPAFAIDRTEVTNAAFAMFARMRGVTGIAMPRYLPTPALVDADRPTYPVASLTWSEARAYCRYLGKALPTTAQWEKALRGGRALSTGANPAPERSLPWATDALDRANVGGAPQPVGTSPGDISPDGVLDLAGNVQEWTATAVTYAGSALPGWHVARGGSWGSGPGPVLVEYTMNDNPRPDGTRDFAVGVRCVEPAASTTQPKS